MGRAGRRSPLSPLSALIPTAQILLLLWMYSHMPLIARSCRCEGVCIPMWPHYPVFAGRPCVVGVNRIVAIVPRALLRLTVQRLLIWMSGPCALSGIELQPVEGVLNHATVASPWSSVDGHRSGQACCETAWPERVGASWAPALLPPCPPRGLPVEHRCGQTDGGSQEHQGVTHEMDQHEPDAHDFLPPLSQEGWGR